MKQINTTLVTETTIDPIVIIGIINAAIPVAERLNGLFSRKIRPMITAKGSNYGYCTTYDT